MLSQCVSVDAAVTPPPSPSAKPSSLQKLASPSKKASPTEPTSRAASKAATSSSDDHEAPRGRKKQTAVYDRGAAGAARAGSSTTSRGAKMAEAAAKGRVRGR